MLVLVCYNPDLNHNHFFLNRSPFQEDWLGLAKSMGRSDNPKVEHKTAAPSKSKVSKHAKLSKRVSRR